MKDWNLFARHKRFRLVGAFCLHALVLSGCSRDNSWNLVDITGVMPPLAFRLTDDTGQAVNADTKQYTNIAS